VTCRGVLVLVAPILGGLVSVVFIRALGFKKFTGGEVLLGLVVFVISLIVQQPIQQLPILVNALPAILSNPAAAQTIIGEFLASLDTAFKALVALWLGFVAGLVQTAFKYVFTKGKRYVDALNIGLGFGVTEALYVGVSGFIYSALIAGVTNARGVPTYLYALSVAERFSASLFHVGSTLFLVHAAKSGISRVGVAVVVVVHGSIDTLAALTQLTGSPILLAATEALTLAVGLVLVLKLYKGAIQEPEERPIW